MNAVNKKSQSKPKIAKTVDKKVFIETLVKSLNKFKAKPNPSAKKNKDKKVWLKKKLKTKGLILIKTVDGNILLNLKLSGMRYGVYFDNRADFLDFVELIQNNDSKIMSLLEAMEEVNGLDLDLDLDDIDIDM